MIWVSEKICSKCGKIKDITEFHLDVTHHDGHKSQCKKCRSMSKRKYGKRNLPPEQAKKEREYHANWYEQNKDRAKANARKWQDTHKKQFRRIVNRWQTENQVHLKAYRKCQYQKTKHEMETRV